MARAVGLDPQLAKRVMDLTTSEMMVLARRAAHCVSIKIDSKAFGGLMSALDQENNDQALMHECIRLEASRDMMVELFGITNRRYSLLRQMNGLPPGNGRSKECSEDEAHRIFEACDEQGWKCDPKSMIAIAKQLDISLRHIWDELRKYDDIPRSTSRRNSA